MGRKVTAFSVIYTSILFVTLALPGTSWAGGEQSGGGAVLPISHRFETKEEALQNFSELTLHEAYYDADHLSKIVDKVRLPGIQGQYYKGDAELCLEGDQVETVYPDSDTGEVLIFPIEAVTTDCVEWRVRRKEQSLPKIFRVTRPTPDGAYWAKRKADDYARDGDNDARGEPYCEKYGEISLRPPTSFRIEFKAKVRGILNSTREVTVGNANIRLFECKYFQRQRQEYADYVSEGHTDPRDWIQMAGGEQSGGGGKKAYKR